MLQSDWLLPFWKISMREIATYFSIYVQSNYYLLGYKDELVIFFLCFFIEYDMSSMYNIKPLNYKFWLDPPYKF